MGTTSNGIRYPDEGQQPNVNQDIKNVADDVNSKLVRTVSSQAARNALSAYEGMPVARTDLRMLELLGAGSGVLRAIFGPMSVTKTGCDSSIGGTAMTGTDKRGMHGAVTKTRPYGTGVPFQGLLIVKGYANVQATSVAALGSGDPDDTAKVADRQQNAGNLQELRGMTVIDFFDTGTADSFIYQPLFKAETGTITPVADPRLTYSICIAVPKAL